MLFPVPVRLATFRAFDLIQLPSLNSSPHPRIHRQSVPHLQIHTSFQRLLQIHQLRHAFVHRLDFRPVLHSHRGLQYV